MLNIFLAMLETAEEKQLFTRLYEDNRSRMFSVALGVLRDEHLAEDAVNQAFLKLIQGLRRFEDFDSSQLRNYLVIVVKSTAIDIYNKRRKVVEVSFDESHEVDSKHKDASFHLQLEYDELLEVIEQLPEIYSEALYLSYHLGLTSSEIASSLNITVNAAKVRLTRARIQLRTMLEGIEALT